MGREEGGKRAQIRSDFINLLYIDDELDLSKNSSFFKEGL